MKLPLKKMYFDLIKKGLKHYEFRESHLTFICEETGETLRREVVSCYIAEEEHADNIRGSYPRVFDKKENIIVFKMSINQTKKEG